MPKLVQGKRTKNLFQEFTNSPQLNGMKITKIPSTRDPGGGVKF